MKIHNKEVKVLNNFLEKAGRETLAAAAEEAIKVLSPFKEWEGVSEAIEALERLTYGGAPGKKYGYPAKGAVEKAEDDPMIAAAKRRASEEGVSFVEAYLLNYADAAVKAGKAQDFKQGYEQARQTFPSLAEEALRMRSVDVEPSTDAKIKILREPASEEG